MSNKEIPLGKASTYPKSYDPELLFPVAREANRLKLGIDNNSLPFSGNDHWRAYEVSWLDAKGKPVVAMADIVVPATSVNLIESKSMKLYLNSLNLHRMSGFDEASSVITADLSRAAGCDVAVRLFALADPQIAAAHTSDLHDSIVVLDDLSITTDQYQPAPELLRLSDGDVGATVSETLASHLFRSNCPITAQPDWGSIVVSYRGRGIDHSSLLQYIVSYREHEGFHEHCAEQIFCDLMQRCCPESLCVSINFMRRGGLEINPVRASNADLLDNTLPRFIRQ